MLSDVKSNRSKIFNDDISNMQMKFNERRVERTPAIYHNSYKRF